MNLCPKTPFERQARIALAVMFLVASVWTAIAMAHARSHVEAHAIQFDNGHVGLGTEALVLEADNLRQCTVRLGGCSGVVVSPEGHILTAGHCQLPETVTVYTHDQIPFTAHKVYDTGAPEGCVVFKMESTGNGFPCVAVSNRPARVGERIETWGYPARSSGDGSVSRMLERTAGQIVAAKMFHDEDHPKGRPSLGEFTCYMTTNLGTAEGWSGGPLLNEQGEVIGVLTGHVDTDATLFTPGKREGLFVSWSAVREAYEAAIQPSEGFTAYLRVNCPPCERFKADCDSYDPKTGRGVYCGIPFQALSTKGDGPRFYCNGVCVTGYQGKPVLNGWLKDRMRPRLGRRQQPQQPPQGPSPFVREPEQVCGDDGVCRPVERIPRRVTDYGDEPTPAVDERDFIRIAVCINPQVDYLKGFRGTLRNFTEDTIKSFAAENGYDVEVKIIDRDLDGTAYDEFMATAWSKPMDRSVCAVALVPTQTEIGFAKGMIAGFLERMVREKLNGCPLSIQFERKYPDEYERGLAALRRYSARPVDQQGPQDAPFSGGNSLLVGYAIIKSRVVDGIAKIVNRIRGKK